MALAVESARSWWQRRGHRRTNGASPQDLSTAMNLRHAARLSSLVPVPAEPGDEAASGLGRSPDSHACRVHECTPYFGVRGDIIAGCLAGLEDKTIATNLEMSVKTVRMHWSH